MKQKGETAFTRLHPASTNLVITAQTDGLDKSSMATAGFYNQLAPFYHLIFQD